MIALFQIFFEASGRALLVAAAVAFILRIARVRAGAVQHAAWLAVLGAMLLMPVLPYCLPSLPVRPPAIADLNPITLPEPLPSAPRIIVRPAPIVESAPTAIPEMPHPPRWPFAIFTIYMGGLIAILYRLAAGWRFAQRIVRESTPLPNGLRESAQIATPFTIGVFSPQIILPRDRTRWTAGQLDAVLAHETAHVRRRDPLVGLIAHLNRAIFWFHPLAWWLVRKLAASAEHACDDAAILAVGESRKYAEVLLDLADTARRSGGRLLWHAAGIDGTGLLGERIDRIVHDNFPRRLSPARKTAVALACAASIFLAAACRRAVAPLQDDPKIAADRADMQARVASYKAATSMSLDQVAGLEAGLKHNPDDLESRKKLLLFYTLAGQAKLGELPTIRARRPHVLWVIRHDPEDPFAASLAALISPAELDALPDPAGYAEARQAWLDQAERPDASVKVLMNAAAFLTVADKPLAEKLLLRAQALEPQVSRGHLARLYFEALVGSNARMAQGVIRSVSMAEAHGAYANEVRRKLAQSNDPELLTAIGESLMFRGPEHYIDHHIDFDPVQLGQSYLERARQLDPQSVRVHQSMLYARMQQERKTSELSRLAPEQQDAALSRLPSVERFVVLARIAENSYMQGEISDYYRHDSATAKVDWERAAKHARESLQLATQFPNDRDYGTAIFKANMVLGMVSMRNGKQKEAVHFMLEASRAPASEELKYNHQYFAFKLPEVLLKYGERASVIEFLERLANINISQKPYLLESAELIRRGRKPRWYQG
jgi:BlaR1 peptidase M56